MSADHRAELKNIRSFPSLVRFLRDEMGWPIDTDDFEEITFEYTAEELGIDAASAAKIEKDGIKRLRPLSPNQPWSIFFVKFEPKRLPVVALRRILSRVALKKRASANSDERAAWAADDLLFVSNYGEGDARQISFAHFSQDESKDDLPTLKVLGWDNLDTPLHLDHVAELLTERLAWPDGDSDIARWRESWRAAFTLRHREVITTSKMLAIRLAELARTIRDRIKTVLAIETKNGPVTKLMKAFQEALVHDLDTEGFADMYAQTIAYGLLSARVTNPNANTADSFASQLPVTNPFLKELMETFLHVGGRKRKAGSHSGIDFDELGVSEVVELLDDANMEAVVRDFGDQNPQEDPVIHFYELFLKEYDAKKRMQRGVFYTPRPVVSYIVRSVHELLKTEFGLADGLADTTTWGEMAERHEGVSIPEGVKATDRFVTILDPATGTGTFLVEAIDVIHRTLTEKWKREGNGDKKILGLWNDYVPKHLLPRLHGYELLMAPYAIAHLKIGLKLHETGYRFESDERARIYLTNALEPAHDSSGQLEFMIPALAHEAEAVNAVKKHQRFTVVIGNPPYSVNSANDSRDSSGRPTFIGSLIDDYRKIDGQPLGEKNPKMLQDDYVKFIRFTEWVLTRRPTGIVGFVTNHSYLDNLTFRGMRRRLLDSFSTVFVCDLHGNSNKMEIAPNCERDENVFDIKQGVALLLAIRNQASSSRCLWHAEMWGTRNAKYKVLSSESFASTPRTMLYTQPPAYLFIPQSTTLLVEYHKGVPLKSVFSVESSCMNTARDAFVIDSDRETLLKRIERIASNSLPSKEAADLFDIQSTGWWSLDAAIKKLKATPNWEQLIVPCLYRPFDLRWLFHHAAFIDRPRTEVNRHMLQDNLSLVTTRQTKEPFAVVVTNRICGQHKIAAVYDRSYFFPLFLYEETPSLNFRGKGPGGAYSLSQRLNFSVGFLDALSAKLQLPQTGAHGLPDGLTSEDVFRYAYAVLHSPAYRIRYAEFLKIDFPRLPLTSSLDLFRNLSRLGADLVSLHLMEPPELENFITTYSGPNNPEVQRVGWSDDTVWLDAAATKKGQPAKPGTIGFHGVPEEVWNFHIGGYQVCEKWLKDRKGRTLTADDIAHYHRIVVALSETIRLMGEIDEVIDAHGGWPAAFTTNAATSKISISSSAQIISLDDTRAEREKFKTLLPLYSLKAAAGYFGDGESVEPEGWVQADGLGTFDERMFVCQAIGRSMEPIIKDSDYVVLRANPVGSRQGKIVLAQYHGPADPDTGGAFTIKKYSSEKGADEDNEWRHTRIVLSPLNPEYNPIIIPEESAESFRIIAEFVAVLRSPG